ncbi:GreA/GreB family elongation factor [Exiguobacterium sp. B2(2022)]|uniref:GreA/GreB family elongation factor n=1 Tax=Exiguobacterium sp. B2(2022) TaxID=2992755 RepID=UPI00237B6BB7|nr:GreA/GreB family elongation factor [Exiguobacterium sp. B2(2022)]MDE0562755.1 GreA/GreB family elongation factor [Exiguobacterium sp. B2(2022)]
MKPQLTENGHEQLKNKLTILRKARTDARERIRTARKFCDFREDVTYTEAVRDVERIEADILELEHFLDDATIVESEQSEVVTFGNRVVIREGDEETESYRIVSEAEADVERGSISMTSPLGRSLMGASVGQTIQVETPGGTIQVEVLNIEP